MARFTIGSMRRMSQRMSFGNSPKFKESERVRTTDNGIERFAVVRSWSYHESDEQYHYWVKLESNDIDRMRLKKESELRSL